MPRKRSLTLPMGRHQVTLQSVRMEGTKEALLLSPGLKEMGNPV